MKKGSTLFLRAVLVVIALIALALCVFAFPQMGPGLAAEFPAVPYLEYFMIVFYASAIPFYIALLQSWKLLNYIDRNTAFSELSVRALRVIKYCGVAISLFLAAGMPFAYGIAETDDAPGVILIWAMVIGAPLVISVFAALLEKLLQNAIDLKSENDLTV